MNFTLKNLERLYKFLNDNHVDSYSGGADFGEYDEESDLLEAVSRSIEMIEEEFGELDVARVAGDAVEPREAHLDNLMAGRELLAIGAERAVDQVGCSPPLLVQHVSVEICRETLRGMT